MNLRWKLKSIQIEFTTNLDVLNLIISLKLNFDFWIEIRFEFSMCKQTRLFRFELEWNSNRLRGRIVKLRKIVKENFWLIKELKRTPNVWWCFGWQITDVICENENGIVWCAEKKLKKIKNRSWSVKKQTRIWCYNVVTWFIWKFHLRANLKVEQNFKTASVCVDTVFLLKHASKHLKRYYMIFYNVIIISKHN